MGDAEEIIDDISSEEEENMKSLGFEWEKTFGKLTPRWSMTTGG